MKSLQKISENTLKIESFLKTKDNGDHVSYKMIENEADVTLDNKGKTYLRTALKRLKLEYEMIRGEGIILASPDNAMIILTDKLVKIDNTVKRGENSYSNLIPHYSKLSIDDQHKINFVGAAFGAIRLAAQNGKKMLSKKQQFNPSDKQFVNI